MDLKIFIQIERHQIKILALKTLNNLTEIL